MWLLICTSENVERIKLRWHDKTPIYISLFIGKNFLSRYIFKETKERNRIVPDSTNILPRSCILTHEVIKNDSLPISLRNYL